MPILRDDGPPVSNEAINEARSTLPSEYGYKIVGQGRSKVLLVRVPRAKPDYNYELADVALYVTVDELKDVKHVILVGDEKAVRMDPIRLRDHIREQVAEDGATHTELVRRLARDFGSTVVVSASNMNHKALAIRVPARSVNEITEDQLKKLKETLAPQLASRMRDCQYAYLVADVDFDRLGRRVFVEMVAPEMANDILSPRSGAANPLHLAHAVSGGTTAGAAPPDPGRGTPTTTYTPPAPSMPQVMGTGQGSRTPTMIAPSGPSAYMAARQTAVAPNYKAAPVVAPPAVAAPPPLPAPIVEAPVASRAYETTSDTDEYAVIVSKPKSAAPASPVAAAPVATQPVATAPVATDPVVVDPAGRAYETTHDTDEYAVIVSKPRASAPSPSALGAQALPTPAVVTPPGPAHDNGAPVEPIVTIAEPDDLGALKSRFSEAGYEVMTGVEVMGHTFDLAAHKMDGKRVLAKRFVRFTESDRVALTKTAEDLAADVCLVLTKDAAAGVRLATWGTRLVVLTPAEAAQASL